MIDSRTAPTGQTIGRIDMVRGTSALFMIGFILGGSLLILTRGDDRLFLFIGLHGINMGVTMTIAVGALGNHKVILEREETIIQGQERIQALLAKYDKRIEAKLERLADLENRLLSAASDEVADQRAGRN